jgi:hypothetical protein
MKRFKNISLVYECDQLTLERAATLAKDNRAKLTIVYPVQEGPTVCRVSTRGGRV